MRPSRQTWRILSLAILASLPTVASAQQTAKIWKNTAKNVKYVGTDQCIGCHQEQFSSYRLTTHSVATTKTDAHNEAAGRKLNHPVLNSWFEVIHRGDQMIHREVIPDVDGAALITTERQLDYSVGSGQHAKSYLFREGAYWGQSPLTWYRDPNDWRMSPGFAIPNHPSFHRKIGVECAFCHVGMIDRKDHNPYQFELVETTIGCERCHGPGELHVNKHRNHPAGADGVDHTIVNPDRLSRELAESICQQCHLQGVAWITTAGKGAWDFRPGTPLVATRIDYRFSIAGEGMRIVGHVEQMHESECYRQTKTLTCTTCHDPHNVVPREKRIDAYRETCLGCHEDQACGKPLAERLQEAANSCYQCHMPKAETNVTHAAFHNHTIDIYPKASKRSRVGRLKLDPILDVSRLPQREQDRCLALAKVSILRGQPSNPDYHDFGLEASETLIRLKNGGLVDAVVDSRLALLAFAQDQRAIARDLARETVRKEPRPTIAHIEAASLLAKMAFQDGDKIEAVRLYRKATQYHRDALDFYYLGLCESNVGNTQAAIGALQRSLAIDPLMIGPHQALEAIYRVKDQPAKADYHAELVRKIEAYRQRRRNR